MLCAEVTHKVLRTDTVYNYLMDLKGSRFFHDDAIKGLVGEIVLTRYDLLNYVDGDISCMI